MSSKTFADKMVLFLDRYKNYSEKDKRIVHYGLETIYIFITKLLFITIISLFLGITKEMYIFIFFYSILRKYASGLHLSTSIGCTIVSTIILLTIPYLAILIKINMPTRIIIALICTIIFAIYSPADTYRKPIINGEKRRRLKFKSISVCIIYIFLTFIISDIFLLNCITLSISLQSLLIIPVTYKFFKQPYNNYKEYI